MEVVISIPKKIVLLLVVIFCSSALFAADYKITKNEDGTCTITEYLGYGGWGELNIPLKINRYEVSSIGNDTFNFSWGLDGINRVIIPVTVTYIGERAFANMKSVESIRIPERVTFIGPGAFTGCKRLVLLQVDLKNTTYAQIQGILFNKTDKSLHSYLSGLKDTNYSIPDGILSIGDSAFKECNNLKTVSIPEEVKTIGNHAFSGCKSLQGVLIPKSVNSIGSYAFAGCRYLQNILIPESVTTIGVGAF